MLDFTLLIISLCLSSVGSFLDIYSTSIFTKDLGADLEANKRVRKAIEEHHYKREIFYEAIIIVLIGVADSLGLYSSFFLFCFVFLIARGLVAAHNLQNIVEYRTIGIEAFKENRILHRQTFQNASLMNRVKYSSPYLAEALICLIVYVMLLTVDFPLVVVSRYFVFGLASCFLVLAYYSSHKDC